VIDFYRVEAVPILIKGRAGYDILVNDPEATVQDYIDALERFIEENTCYRSRVPDLASCYSCDLCCRERIPVTLVDAVRLSDRGLQETVANLLHVFVDGRVVDITMGLDETGRCIFLDRGKRLCTAYQKRPLVCRTFICCPSTRKARQLREEIVNAGEDELVRAWFGIKGKNRSPIIHEGVAPRPHPADYAKTAFYGVDEYSRVKLKKVCSPGLWNMLVTQKKRRGS